MKKAALAMILIAALLVAGAAYAQEVVFYTITYHSNLEYDNTKTVSKEPGESIEIADSMYGMTGMIFAGWAIDPDADTAEYLPGDTYSADKNLDLHAVWLEAYDLGELTGLADYVIPAFPVPNENVYIKFTVAESDHYRLQSTGQSMKKATSFSSIQIMKQDGNWWDTVSRGEYIINDSYEHLDFTVSAQLEAGESYMLSLYCPPNAVNLNVDNRISFITYHSNLESDNTKTVSKDPGESIEIDRCNYGWQGLIFAGWATDPDAETAEYLPGDTYSADENLDLYAVWMEAYDLGELNGVADYVIPAFPVPNEHVYIKFTVAETDYYRLQSTGQSMKKATSFSSIEIMKLDESWWNTVSRGEYITNDSYEHLDFNVSAQLEAGESYMLSFYCPPNAVKLNVDNRISFITYHSNLESDNTKTVSKEPGKSIKIDRCNYGWQGLNFAGWATDPDAVTAEYLPGDTYSADENLELYALWLEAYELGKITGPETFIIPAFPVPNEQVYIAFTVSESGYYRLRSADRSMEDATSFSSIQVMKLDENWWETISRGEYVTEAYRNLDFTVTAYLEAGESYMLAFYCPPNAVKLLCEPQYESQPYEAAVKLPAGLKIVENQMFAGASLQSVYIPEHVEKIASEAFKDCTELSKVIVAADAVQIEEEAFSGCGELLIVANEQSAAHRFAQENGYEFRRLEE